MSSIAGEERKQVMRLHGACPSASLALSSKASSSFCSFDVKIWEELHLQSLTSASCSSSTTHEDDYYTEKGAQLSWKAEKAQEPKSSTSGHGFSFFSSSTSARASFSGLSSPHRLSSASSTSGYPLMLPRRDNTLLSSPFSNSPLHYKAEQAPLVVQVIQTGSMSFTSDELVLQQATAINTEEPFLNMESPHLAESITPPPIEETPTIAQDSNASDAPVISAEKSIALAGFPHVKYMQISAPDVYSAPISPLKSKGSIPFKWEETPGRPKLAQTDLGRTKANIPTLQLPPKLLQSSFSSSTCNSPYSRSHSKHAPSPSSCSTDSFTSKPTSVKSLWNSFVQSGRRSYREGGGGARARFNMLFNDEDPWSPTSTLIGPDASLSSTSSTSSATLEAMCTSPGRNAEVQSTASRGSGACHMDEKSLYTQSSALVPCSSSSSLCDGPSYICNDLPNLAPSMERRPEELPLGQKATNRLRGFWKSCRRWRSASSCRKRNHEEAEMWEPTLATYFHSMELERSSSTSGQSLLSHQRSLEKPRSEEIMSSCAAAGMENCIESMNHLGSKSLLAPSLMKEDVMIFSANSRTATQKLSLGLKGKNAKIRRKGGGWVLRKLKKSSRVLAAMLRAVAKGSTNTGLATKKCKRRRLPYQHINW